jgi:Spy/CpxP family protein refolding chaperone
MRRSILVSLSAATVAAVFLATGASVDAQRVGPRGGGPDGRRPTFTNAQARRGVPAREVRQGRRGGPARMADRLDLTTEQRDAIAVINQERRDVIAPLADELRLAESNLRRAIFADPGKPRRDRTHKAGRSAESDTLRHPAMRAGVSTGVLCSVGTDRGRSVNKN